MLGIKERCRDDVGGRYFRFVSHVGRDDSLVDLAGCRVLDVIKHGKACS